MIIAWSRANVLVKTIYAIPQKDAFVAEILAVNIVKLNFLLK